MSFEFVGSGAPVSEFAQAAYAEAIQTELASVFGGSVPFAVPRGRDDEEQWTEDKGAPPMAARALASLPMVRATEEDLSQDGNEYCCVCLEAHAVGDLALQLPCGHLFHRDCGVDWLAKHCTCPNCRYELESDNAAFEAGRAARMRSRRPRFRVRDLSRRSVKELRNLLKDHGVCQRGACEKRDLVDKLIASGAIQIVPEPCLHIACDEFSLRTAWTTRNLKDLMLLAGVDSSRCVEKDELVDALAASSRVHFAIVHNDDQRAAGCAAALAALDEESRRRRADFLFSG